jgi:transketolase N-terminal domain/subunit
MVTNLKFNRTYCLMGDGESMEGNVWEALNFAGFYKLDNLCAIIDVNRLGQSDPAPLQHDMNAYRFKILLLLSFICYSNYNKWKKT